MVNIADSGDFLALKTFTAVVPERCPKPSKENPEAGGMMACGKGFSS